MGLDSFIFAEQHDVIYDVVENEVMYWRKFNAIHSWFVKNVQDGIDDCGKYSVPIETLRELLDIVIQCIEDNSKIQELLPPKEGFFFGSSEIDQSFIEELERTRNNLERLIEQFDDGCYLGFSYVGNW